MIDERWYLGLSLKAPFGGVFVHRQTTDRIVVGGAWQDTRSLQVVLDGMKARLIEEYGKDGWRRVIHGRDCRGLVEDVDDNAARGFEALIRKTIDAGWHRVYQPIEVCRQALEALIPVHGATSKLEIDSSKPGAKLLNDALLRQTVGGCYDALSLVAFQIGEDFPPGGGRGFIDYKIERSLPHWP